MRVRVRIVGLLVCSLVIEATTSQAVAGQKWDVEAHGGALVSSNPTSGTSALPTPGPDISLGGTSVTRRVPSWYFGDGAAILNQVQGARSPVRIVPLDPILQSPIVERQSGVSFGVRVDRALTPRFGLEFALDGSQSPLAFRSTVKGAVAGSQASFLAMWNTLLTFPAGGAQVVTTDTNLDDKRGHQIVTSGALLINLLSSPAFTTYVAAGAGYIATRGGAPAITVVGNYDFLFPPVPANLPGLGQFHFNETDTVKIQSVVENSATWLFGGGVKYALGNRWGVRADLRDYVNRNVIRTTVTTSPKDVPSGQGGATFLFSANAPSIVFSGSALSLSTLSTDLNDFQTFKGRGTVNQVNMSAGVYWRF
jgi:hypothetical protein